MADEDEGKPASIGQLGTGTKLSAAGIMALAMGGNAFQAFGDGATQDSIASIQKDLTAVVVEMDEGERRFAYDVLKLIAACPEAVQLPDTIINLTAPPAPPELPTVPQHSVDPDSLMADSE